MMLLPVVLPPSWEEVVGWSGGAEARWLSVCWEPCGDHPWMEDGRTGQSGHPWGYLAWANIPPIRAVLSRHKLGNSDEESTERLLIDRTLRRVYVADAAEARSVVRGQWPPQEPVQLSQEQIDAIVDNVRRAMEARPMPTPQEVMVSMRRHSRLVAEMIRWLELWQAEREGRP